MMLAPLGAISETKEISTVFRPGLEQAGRNLQMVAVEGGGRQRRAVRADGPEPPAPKVEDRVAGADAHEANRHPAHGTVRRGHVEAQVVADLAQGPRPPGRQLVGDAVAQVCGGRGLDGEA